MHQLGENGGGELLQLGQSARDARFRALALPLRVLVVHAELAKERAHAGDVGVLGPVVPRQLFPLRGVGTRDRTNTRVWPWATAVALTRSD